VVAYFQHAANEIYRGQEQIYGRQAAIAEDTEQRELRAYLEFRSDRLSVSGDGIHKTSAYFKITNDGQTPAYDVTILSCLVLHDYPLGAVMNMNVQIIPGGNAKVYLAPHSFTNSHATFDGNLTRDQIKDICEGDKYRLYLLGRVDYTDAFKIRRHLRFAGAFGGPEMKASVPELFEANPIKGPNGLIGSGEGDIFEYDPLNNFEY
jgi:hypothetical protein